MNSINSGAMALHTHIKTSREKKKKTMAPAVKLLSVLLLVSIFATGFGERCNLSSVKVQQTNTGLKDGFDTVFEVEVKNLCHCAVKKVSLSSLGFASSMPVDPKLFRLKNGNYLVNDGKGIPSSVSIKFRYAWDHYFRMTPASFQIMDCK